MTFFSLLFALILEQLKGESLEPRLNAWAARWMDVLARQLDAGGASHAWLVLAAFVGLPSLFLAWIHWVLSDWSGILSWIFQVGVLFACVNLRQWHLHLARLKDALSSQDAVAAIEAMKAWLGLSETEPMSEADVPSQALSHALDLAHRQVFGPVMAFLILAWVGLGPVGALAYRLLDMARSQRHTDARYKAVTARSWGWADALPGRLTAAGFAVVGQFEEAVAAWRQPEREGQTLPSRAWRTGLGAMGLTSPDQARREHLETLSGLVLRALVLWVLLLALLTLAKSMG